MVATRSRVTFLSTNFELSKQGPSNLLPGHEGQDCIMASTDVKDDFLTVKQEVDTRVTCTDATGAPGREMEACFGTRTWPRL